MKLWLLDADVIIDLLSLDVLDNLVNNHKIFAASTVIDEVKYFNRTHMKISVDLRKNYILSGLIHELSASINELEEIISLLPPDICNTIDDGELESLAILTRDESLIFCTCDAAAIRILPLLGISNRGISVENLLQSSGLQKSDLIDRHTEQYFKNNLDIGKKNKIYFFNSKKV